jgi:hypothetical protein
LKAEKQVAKELDVSTDDIDAAIQQATSERQLTLTIRCFPEGPAVPVEYRCSDAVPECTTFDEVGRDKEKSHVNARRKAQGDGMTIPFKGVINIDIHPGAFIRSSTACSPTSR